MQAALHGMGLVPYPELLKILVLVGQATTCRRVARAVPHPTLSS